MNKHWILVIDDFDQKFFDELSKFGEVIKANDISELSDSQLSAVNILVVRSKTRVDRELVNGMLNLECVISATHGKDHIAVDYLREKKIEFYNVPVQARDVAQGVMAYIFAHTANLVGGDRSMKRGEWRKKELKGLRLRGKTLGIIGYGRIGREVARMASALEMNIIFYDPYVEKTGATATLDELLKVSDFVTLHIPLTEKTRNIIGRDEINKMKNGAYLINTARGGIVDEEALLEAINEGKLSGAALDVYRHQPPFNDEASDKLVKDMRVIATPHSIGQTAEAIEEKGEGVTKIIKDYIERSCRAKR
jgi:D-3-phosphoglycerate dehydrogenase